MTCSICTISRIVYQAQNAQCSSLAVSTLLCISLARACARHALPPLLLANYVGAPLAAVGAGAPCHVARAADESRVLPPGRRLTWLLSPETHMLLSLGSLPEMGRCAGASVWRQGDGQARRLGPGCGASTPSSPPSHVSRLTSHEVGPLASPAVLCRLSLPTVLGHTGVQW